MTGSSRLKAVVRVVYVYSVKIMGVKFEKLFEVIHEASELSSIDCGKLRDETEVIVGFPCTRSVSTGKNSNMLSDSIGMRSSVYCMRVGEGGAFICRVSCGREAMHHPFSLIDTSRVNTQTSRSDRGPSDG